jgi:hypothetical protein
VGIDERSRNEIVKNFMNKSKVGVGAVPGTWSQTGNVEHAYSAGPVDRRASMKFGTLAGLVLGGASLLTSRGVAHHSFAGEFDKCGCRDAERRRDERRDDQPA